MRRDVSDESDETETSTSSTSEADEQVGRSIQRLARTLVGRNYQPRVGPGKTTVHLHLTHVCGQMDETTGALTLHGWFAQVWSDWRLRWSEDTPGPEGIHSIRLTADSVWKPDITQYNTFEKSEVYEETNVLVYHEGSVLWVPKVTFYTLCSRDAQNSAIFNCTLKLGSWTMDAGTLPLEAPEGRGDDEASSIWYDAACPYVVSNLQSRIHSETYECCPDMPFQTYVSTFDVRRRR
jgi:hypothetical protein